MIITEPNKFVPDIHDRMPVLPGGADFHARYLLTDRGGLRIDAGFSTDAAGQKTDMSFMDFNLAQKRRKEFNRDAQVYELIEPVLQIAANGYVERI